MGQQACKVLLTATFELDCRACKLAIGNNIPKWCYSRCMQLPYHRLKGGAEAEGWCEKGPPVDALKLWGCFVLAELCIPFHL